MTIEIIRLLIDAGFVVLIWAVQLVIYPSFKFYSKANLFQWHRLYTKRVTVIVLPLMGSQLLLGFIYLFQVQNTYTFFSFVIILALWVITFTVFVPLHQSIDIGKPVENVCLKLEKKNWIRTLLWSLLFIISIFNYLSI
ncbi:hypothetical protein BTO05_01350 [Winogradskyella sp. PC-19]|uniref:hypothetical protein n=1 Tax=unclassified Winogradskyella TaxID=2615021 RepID=UPI000B3D354D|nr:MULTISPECIES: hypothetical protein [unclassified Winogradskyella]ARV08354.1 hypothetical protein BTO05_01350 [Winogradskyella sp. PC-19]